MPSVDELIEKIGKSSSGAAKIIKERKIYLGGEYESVHALLNFVANTYAPLLRENVEGHVSKAERFGEKELGNELMKAYYEIMALTNELLMTGKRERTYIELFKEHHQAYNTFLRCSADIQRLTAENIGKRDSFDISYFA